MAISKEIIKISIIVPCYNQAEFLDECLTSVFNQTYTDWECIIVNDGSPDHTEELALKWCERDPRFSYTYKENGGLSSARNIGLSKVSGDWIQFLDSDDLLPNNRFKNLVERINSIDEVDIIITNFNLQKDNTLLAPYCILNSDNFNLKDIVLKWDIEFTIPIHCGLFKQKLFNDFRFNENLKAKEDWLMWSSFFINNPKTLYESKTLATYRIHDNSMTRNNKISITENNLKVTFYLWHLLNKQPDLSNAFLEQRVQQYTNLIYDLEVLKNKILNSNSYRLGNYIINPFSWIKNVFNK